MGVLADGVVARPPRPRSAQPLLEPTPAASPRRQRGRCWRAAFVPLVAALRQRNWRQLWLVPLGVGLVALSSVLGGRLHPAVFDYTASTPWLAAVVRIPLTVVAPALHLSAAGAILQTALVLALAQPVLGARRLLALGLAGHVLSTVLVRLALEMAPQDLPHGWLHELDSGPSVAVLTVAVAAAMVTDATPVAALIVTGVGVEVGVLRSLSGVEHSVGVSVGLLWSFIELRTRRRTWASVLAERHPGPTPRRRVPN